MRRGVAYRGPSGWVLTRLTRFFRLNRVVCWWPGGASSVLFGLANTEQAMTPKIGCRMLDHEWDLHEEHRNLGTAEQHCRRRPRGTPLRHGGGSSPHYDGSE
jgi:hypothetical protein